MTLRGRIKAVLDKHIFTTNTFETIFGPGPNEFLASEIAKEIGWHPESEKPPVGVVVGAKREPDSRIQEVIWNGSSWVDHPNGFVVTLKGGTWLYLPPEDD